MPISPTFKAKWFWYSALCVLCWGGWALFSKLGSTEIPAPTMQFLFTFGTLPVALALFAARCGKLEKSAKGILYAVANGVLSGIGTLMLFAAYRSGGNTSVITAATALYPLVTVVLAVLVLQERLRKLQVVGLGFAGVAMILFSF